MWTAEVCWSSGEACGPVVEAAGYCVVCGNVLDDVMKRGFYFVEGFPQGVGETRFVSERASNAVYRVIQP